MKKLILSLSVLTFSLQMSQGNAQSNNAPTYEVQVKRLPNNNEGTYYDNSATNRPFIELDHRGNANQVDSYNHNNNGYYDARSSTVNSNNTNPNNNQPYFNKSAYEQQIDTNVRNANTVQDNRSYSNDAFTPNATQTNYRAADYNNQAQNKVERTLAIIKPDAVKSNHIGDIIARYEKSGLRVAGIEMRQLSKDDASDFYAVHKDRPFYNDLVTFMSSGPVVLIVLEGPDAIAKNRQIMGKTDPRQADRGTIRADFANSTTENAVHGSDSADNANKEINDFFDDNELFKRY